LRCLTFDMSGKQRRTHCCRSGTKAPAVVCPLDGGVRRRLLHSEFCARLLRQRSAALCSRSTHAGHTAAGMGRRPMPALAKNECSAGAAYSQGRGTNTAPVLQPLCRQRARLTLRSFELARCSCFAWHLHGGAPPANGRAARHGVRTSHYAKNDRCADCQRTGGPARRRRKARDANHGRCDWSEAFAHWAMVLAPPNVRHERQTTARTLLAKQHKLASRCLSARWSSYSSPARHALVPRSTTGQQRDGSPHGTVVGRVATAKRFSFDSRRRTHRRRPV
jgi:hypothetical protein